MLNNLFKEILGQTKAKDFLNKAWGNKRLASALLFYGPESVGKKLTAYALSQALLCENVTSSKNSLLDRACGNCLPCQEVKEKRSPHILEVNPENKVIKVEKSLEIISFLNLKTSSSARIIIINDAQYLNIQSSNKLLKTLEELPKNNYIILLSPSIKSLLSTIGSRLSKFGFSSLSQKDFLTITNLSTDQAAYFNSSVQDYKKWELVESLPVIEKVINFWTLLFQNNSALLGFVSKNLSKKEEVENFLYVSQKCLLDKIKLNNTRLPQLSDIFKLSSSVNYITLVNLLLVLEKDIKSNINPLLSLENFCIKVEKQITI